ncbi:MAG: DUF2283 domain-containing protein [Cyanobacteria bacterium P01_H01_bin.152]
MKISYNAEDDVLWLVWGDVDESDEAEPGMILDYDTDGKVVGVELLNASQKISDLNLHGAIASPASSFKSSHP